MRSLVLALLLMSAPALANPLFTDPPATEHMPPWSPVNDPCADQGLGFSSSAFYQQGSDGQPSAENHELGRNRLKPGPGFAVWTAEMRARSGSRSKRGRLPTRC